MISVYNLKPKFQRLLIPVLNRLHGLGISANQITLSAITLSFLVGILFWYADHNQWFFLAVAAGLFLRMALNALDGMMARTFNQQSRLGEILNELGDVVSDLFIYFPLIKHEAENLYAVAAFLCLMVLNEFAGVLGKAVIQQRHYDGPMGKSDRALIIGLYALLCFFYVPIDDYMTYAFIVLNSLLVLSTVARVKRTLKNE